MTAKAILNAQDVIIEPFDPAKHDRTAFSCGTTRLDNFLKLTAKKQQAGDFTRVRVATVREQVEILGYYALNAHFLEGDDLPSDLTKNASWSGIPVIYLSMIAVDRRYQGRGIGRTLLVSALTRAANAAKDVGLKAVILDVIDDGGDEITEKRRTFYTSMGFKPFPSSPLRMFITIEMVRKLDLDGMSNKAT